MKLSKLVALDYCLKSIPELLNSDERYQLVLRDSHEVFTGDLVTEGIYGIHINLIDLNNERKIRELIVNDADQELKNSFAKIRFDVIKKLKGPYLKEIVQNPDVLLEVLIKMLESHDVTDNLIPFSFSNYHSFSTNIELPFKVINSDEYEIVSLLSHS